MDDNNAIRAQREQLIVETVTLATEIAALRAALQEAEAALQRNRAALDDATRNWRRLYAAEERKQRPRWQRRLPIRVPETTLPPLLLAAEAKHDQTRAMVAEVTAQLETKLQRLATLHQRVATAITATSAQ